MKEKLVSNVQEKADAELYQEHQLGKKKPFQEPVLTKHETLVENTHFSGSATLPTPVVSTP